MMLNDWIPGPAMTLFLGPLLAIGIAPRDTTDAAALADERAFVEFLDQAHGVHIGPDSEGRIVVKPLWSVVVRREDAFCAADHPQVRRAIEFGIAAECAKKDDPRFDERAWVEQAARRTGDWLVGLPGGPLFPEDDRDRLELQRSADKRLRVILRRRGLYDRLLASWRRHWRDRSACHSDAMRLLALERERFVLEGGRCDGRWEDVIEVCTSWSDDLQSHIAYHPTPSTPSAKRAAARTLFEAGLGRCLGALIERSGDGELIHNVRTLSAATADPVAAETRKRAWQVWRQAGVEQWLDRTVSAGLMPQAVAIALDRCSGSSLDIGQ